MVDYSKEGILELFDFYDKKVLCFNFNEAYIVGLINRGAKVWIRDIHYKQAIEMDGWDIIEKNVKFFNNNFAINVDYSIVKGRHYSDLKMNTLIMVGRDIVIISGKINILRWFFSQNKLNKKKNIIIYSVVPAISKIKLIIPENIDVTIDRYWSLRHPNPIFFFKLIFQWLFIRSSFLRKIFSDKLIVIKC